VAAAANAGRSRSLGWAAAVLRSSSATEDGSSINETLSGLQAGRSTNLYEVDTPEQLQQLLDQLSQGGEPVENNYPGDLVRLPDGSTVGLRDASKSGGPAIDITQAGQAPVKIHLP
jgi:hypothetical protein